jgi:hypothetical protein
MGDLGAHPIRVYKEKYGLTAMLETGTGHGSGVNVGVRSGFTKILTCEIDRDNWNRAMDENVSPFIHFIHFYLGDSVEVLPTMLDQLNGERLLIWLDAHLGEAPIDKRLPLEKELQILTSKRDCSKDVIIVDDLRLYDRTLWGPNAFNIYKHVKNPEMNISKEEIEGFFLNHKIIISTKNEGALVFLPGEPE